MLRYFLQNSWTQRIHSEWRTWTHFKSSCPWLLPFSCDPLHLLYPFVALFSFLCIKGASSILAFRSGQGDSGSWVKQKFLVVSTFSIKYNWAKKKLSIAPLSLSYLQSRAVWKRREEHLEVILDLSWNISKKYFKKSANNLCFCAKRWIVTKRFPLHTCPY